MTYDDAIGVLKDALKAHNAALPKGTKKVDAAAVVAAVQGLGATDIEALRFLREEDLAGCGCPPVRARQVIGRIASDTVLRPAAMPAPVAAPEVVLRTHADVLRGLSDADLLAKYNHDDPGLVGDELARRARGLACLYFAIDRTIATAETLALIATIRAKPAGDSLATINTIAEIGGKQVRAVRVGAALGPQLDKENPFYRGEALLQPGDVCAHTRESYTGIDHETRQLMRVAIDTPCCLVIRDTETARAVIETARRADGPATLAKRYPGAAIALDAMQPNQRPPLRIQAGTGRQEEPRGGPFVDAAVQPFATGTASASAMPLPNEQIMEIHAAAIQCRLADSRVALLSGIDRSFVASMPHAGNPSSQLLSDLHTLNGVRALDDGSVPFRSWLSTALAQSRGRRESAVFQAALAGMGGGVGASGHDDVLTRLTRLLPSQFEVVMFRLNAPKHHIAGEQAPMGTRAMDLIRWAEQQGRVAELDGLV